MITIQSGFNTIEKVKELIANLQYLDSAKQEANIEIQEIEFVTPLAITPLAAIINNKKLNHQYQGENIFYLDVIHFPEGINELDKLALQKTYIPIIKLEIKKYDKPTLSSQINKLHSKFLELLKYNVIADQKFLELITNNTFGFLVGEMLDNVEEHAKANNLYLFAQYWQKNNSCEVCILDDGQGVYGSLKNAGRPVIDSADALRKILEKGLSSKTEFGEIIRGMGIKSTRAALTNREIRGEFFIMSGNAAFFHSAEKGEIFINFERYFWQGTIIMMKLFKPISSFNLYNYVK